MTRTSRPVLCLAVVTVLGTSLAAQQPAPPAAPGGQRAGGPGRGNPTPDDTAGFVSLFNGTTLSGWDGDPRYWRVEGGAIVGQSTPENRVEQNTFLVWRGGRVRDFELKIDFRINGTNSGVQYRSVELPDVGKWVMSGYQADMDFANQFTGNIHNERGARFFLSQRGNVVRGVDGGGRKQIGTIGDPDALKAAIKVNDWNTYHIIARGQTILQLVNGRLTSVFIDEDATNFAAEGLLGLQMHVGDPFKVEYKNIWLKQLK